MKLCKKEPIISVMTEQYFPTKFIYPDQETLFKQLEEKELIGKSPLLDEFYHRLSNILGGASSPTYPGMGIAEALAWEEALRESGLEGVENDMGSFSFVFKTLRDESTAATIVKYRKRLLEKRRI